MRNLNKILLTLAVSGTALLNAPLAYADKYQVNNHYYSSDRYQDDSRYERRYHDEGKRCNNARWHRAAKPPLGEARVPELAK